jgi:hypothetical protein
MALRFPSSLIIIPLFIMPPPLDPPAAVINDDDIIMFRIIPLPFFFPTAIAVPVLLPATRLGASLGTVLSTPLPRIDGDVLGLSLGIVLG